MSKKIESVTENLGPASPEEIMTESELENIAAAGQTPPKIGDGITSPDTLPLGDSHEGDYAGGETEVVSDD